MLGVAALILVLAGATAWGLLARRRSARRAAPIEPLIHPADLADLADRFADIDAEHAARQAHLLELHLRPLVRRRVPVRCIECLPEQRTNRVRFADGTAVNVRGESPGDAGVLAALVLRHAVLPATYRTDARGTHLVFDWSDGRRRMSVLVTGLGQPD
ncbi:MAG: hypothetical protein ABW122_10780 [Ilumatobacteraceae bacterium]